MAENYFGITDTGKRRSNNEDAFIARPVFNGQFIAACVIDGVGGYEGGEVAAQLAHDAILSHLKNTADIKEMMKQALSAANEAIYREKQISGKNKQMACVLTLAVVNYAENKFYYAHVGDTRLYLLRDNSLVKITHDHSFVGYLEDSGRLSEEAAMNHSKRNEIDKAIGFDSHIASSDYIETGESPFLPGDTILLCSDGLTDMIDNSAITSILIKNKTLAIKAKALINAANEAGGKDNITAVLVRNNKTPVQHTATKPAITARLSEENNNYEDNLSETKKNQEEKIIKKNTKKSSAVPLFAVLGISILATLIWLVYQNYTNSKNVNNYSNNAGLPKKRNESEQLLIDSINGTKTKEVFVLNQSDAPPVIITDTISVNKDSLHIIGNGVTIKSDTVYNGAAFTLAPACKYLLLDSLTLEGFDIGIILKNQGLHFKNVHFRNCKIPVQYQFTFDDMQVVNGRFADTIFYNAQTGRQ